MSMVQYLLRRAPQSTIAIRSVPNTVLVLKHPSFSMGKDAGSKSEDVPGGGTYYLRSVPVARLGRATFE